MLSTIRLNILIRPSSQIAIKDKKIFTFLKYIFLKNGISIKKPHKKCDSIVLILLGF